MCHAEAVKQVLDRQKIAGKRPWRGLPFAPSGNERPLAEGQALESELFGTVCESADKREGVSAFLEKRQPKFLDR
jgi:hypothetical protein